MPISRWFRYALFAALIALSVLTYLREQTPPGRPTVPELSSDSAREAPDTNPDRTPVPAGSGFDFYVLALSWSPSYCAAEGAKANRQQCDSGRPYGFVVHGLWPQYERGYPQDCDTSQPRDVPYAVARQLSDIMPSIGLVTYQWRKHGACSGLSQKDYFAVMRAAVGRISIPSAYRQPTSRPAVDPRVVERAFLSANTGLPEDGIALTCDRDYLREVRICLTKDLGFRSCPEVEQSSCRKRAVEMPAAQ